MVREDAACRDDSNDIGEGSVRRIEAYSGPEFFPGKLGADNGLG